MQTIALSESAEALLRRRLAGERVDITEQNRPLYRELAEAGLMIPLHTATGGNESFYRLTEAAVASSTGNTPSTRLPSPAQSPLPCG